jgi:hypothetical protein
MDDEAFNTSVRKFLKIVGVNSQREIEQALARAQQQDAVAGTESLPVAMTLEIPSLKLQVKFDGELKTR